MGRSPSDLPALGPPGGRLEKRNAKGEVIQLRFYDRQGRAEIDIDYDHDHDGSGSPHAHDWDYSKKLKGQRLRPRPMRPGEV